MKTKSLYPIKYVAQQTGLTPHVIRAWEKRYDAVVPQRSIKNRRLYCEEDIRRLRLIKRMKEAGHNLSQVAQLDADELSDFAQQAAPAGVRAAPMVGVRTSPAASGTYEACLTAVLKLDMNGLECALGQAAVDLTRTAFLSDVIMPLFEEIGKLWQAGALKIVHEHMATTVTRNFLFNLLRATPVCDKAPKIVIATLLEQWHDVGALTTALAAAESGWRPVYYGPNLPAEEIASVIKHNDARAAAISISHLLNQPVIVEELRKLLAYVDNEVSIFVGGRGLGGYSGMFGDGNVKMIESIEQLREELSELL